MRVAHLPRSFPGRLAAIALLGVGLRALYLFTIARHTVGIGDWWFFHWQANDIAAGHGFLDPWYALATHHRSVSAAHPPLYPLVLSVISLVGGHSTLDHRSLGLLLGPVTIVLVGLLGRRLGGERIGLVAAGLCALYPLMIAVDGDLMSEVLFSPLIAGMLLTAIAVIDRPSLWRAAGLGALIALAALTRAEALLFLPLLALPVAFVAWRGHPRSWLLGGGVAVAACVVVLAPWTIRNESVFGRFVPISTNDATVLAGANCAKTYAGDNIGGWDITCLRPRTQHNEAKQAAIWRKDGLNYARDHAGQLPKVMIFRLLRIWDLYQPRRQARVFAEGRQVGTEEAGVATFYVFMLLAIPGLLALRRRRGALLVLLVPALVVCVSAVTGYGVPRLRHSFEIPLLVLASAGLVSLVDRVTAGRRERRPAGPPVASPHRAPA